MKKFKIVYDEKVRFLVVLQWLGLNKIMTMKECIELYQEYKTRSDVEISIPDNLVTKMKSELKGDCTFIDL